MSPRIEGILETAVYVDDLEASHAFYGDVLGLERLTVSPRMMTYEAGPSEVLLVFRRGDTTEDLKTPGGVIPGHHSEGPAHFAFRIAKDAYGTWKRHLQARQIAIVGEVAWPKGGRSIYFNDPSGNVLEMATPGLWPIY
ncbi:VOC family protein [Afifella sp. IM 167]|uniref:VOC family protein n=1 Tax=Afifella sp. IM 167 TaxID=2033586 RepID=UPI001CCE1EE7|nr:VOC family protein [Afifella sp. IM 167]MBZ8132648.1 glyoxalase [Afifella sp. IM 167]